jgi:hypothetical protein
MLVNQGDGTYTGTYSNTLLPGTYDVMVLGTVPNSAVPTAPFTRQYEQSVYVVKPFTSTAVVLATNSVLIREQTTIVSGDIIVNNNKQTAGVAGNVELLIREQSVTPAGYSLKAPGISIGNQAVIKSDVYYNTLTSSTTIAPALKHTPLSLPVLTALPPFQVAAPGQTDITVASNQTTTLSPGAYRNVTVQIGGRLQLSAGRYDFNTLVGGDYARLMFSGGAEVRVAATFLTGSHAYVGPGPGNVSVDASGIVIYVGGTSAVNPVVQIGPQDSVFANFYAPNGPMLLGEQSRATGAFFGMDVTVREQSRLTLSSYFLKNGAVALKKEAVQPAPAPAREIPTTIALMQNYPNPFNPSTQIRYALPVQSYVTLTVYNALGQEVARLADEVQEAGYHEVRWNGTNGSGTPVSTGIYFYRMRAGDFVDIKKMLLLK